MSEDAAPAAFKSFLKELRSSVKEKAKKKKAKKMTKKRHHRAEEPAEVVNSEATADHDASKRQQHKKLKKEKKNSKHSDVNLHTETKQVVPLKKQEPAGSVVLVARHQPSLKPSTTKLPKRQPSSAVALPLPPHKYILAPMVGASELAFRLLCRKYGAQVCYTPMMSAAKFATDSNYRDAEFQHPDDNNSCDHPLTCHFSANDPTEFAAAAVRAESLGCDAVDLNLGWYVATVNQAKRFLVEQRV